MGIDFAEAGFQIITPLRGYADIAAVGDLGVTLLSGYFSGSLRKDQVYPGLPEMYIAGQDVTLTFLETIGTPAIGGILSTAGYPELAPVIDIATSGASWAAEHRAQARYRCGRPA
jgi:hypothetical protein